MNYHPTPPHIANIIKRHLPKNPKRILEPAAGEGALIKPLSEKVIKYSNLTIIDIDREKCKILRAKYRNKNIVNANFIEWVINNPRKKFDLILTNPPFSGRPENWVDLNGKKTPLEVAFLTLAINKLSSDGTMIAIVPDSIVRSSKWEFFRENLYDTCSVTYSYQLPEKSFGLIEGIFFLLVVRKNIPSRRINLRRFYRREESLSINLSTLRVNGYRLDYDYYKASSDMSVLMRNIDGRLDRVDNIFANAVRGRIRENYRSLGLLHTCSYNNLNYGIAIPYSDDYFRNPFGYCVAVKRVSRNSHLTFGIMSKADINKCTDCLIYFDSKRYTPIELLFYLRVVYSNENGRAMLLKGTGAKYLSVNEIKSLPFYEIHKLDVELFEKYQFNCLAGNADVCLEIEEIMNRFINYGARIAYLSKKKNKIDRNSHRNTIAS